MSGIGPGGITNIGKPAEYYEIIDRNKERILALWSFPKIDEQFQISLKTKNLIFGTRKIKLPILILLDELNQVEEMRFDFYYSNPLINEVSSLNGNQSLIWVDKCEPILKFKKLDSSIDETNLCAYLFRNRDANFLIINLQTDLLDYEKFRSFFK